MPRASCANALRVLLSGFTTIEPASSLLLISGDHRGWTRSALIVNRVTSMAPDIPQNWAAPLAPTKPPFLWNAPQGSWTQWRGVQQDPIGRNLIETMGVYMHMNLTAKSPKEGLYDSNARLNNLEEIEDWLTHLAPPKWPEEVFGKIDRAKAAEGKSSIRQPLCGVPQFLSLYLDRTQQVRQALP